MKEKINKNSKKILFSLLGMSLISMPVFALISCTNSQKNQDNNKDEEKNNNANNQDFETDPNLKYPNSEFEKDVNELKLSSNLEDVFDLTFNNFSAGNNKKDIFASQIQTNPSILKIKAKKAELNKKIHFKIEGVILEDNANLTGQAKINVVFTNKATAKTENKIFNLSGLNTSFDNTDSNGNKPNNKISNQKSKNEILNYIGLSQEERFKKDNDEFTDALKKYLAFAANINKWEDLRKTLKANKDQIEKFNKKAAKVGMDSFENSAFKGFTLPSYKNGSDEVDGLDILEGEETGKQPSWVDALGKHDVYKTIGLARKIVNEQYLKIAKQTYSLRLTNHKDYQEEINKINQEIEFFTKNEDKYKKSNNERIEELKKNKIKIEKELEEKIQKNKDKHLVESLQNEKKKILEDYDKKIKYYQDLNVNGYINHLKTEIEELKKKEKEKNVFIPENGTMWIMDYQLDSKGYPTKWYFGTNSHVAKAITKNRLVSFSITKVNNDIKVGSTLRLSQLDDNITMFSFNKPKAIRKVFDGVDFLKNKVSEYLSSELKEKYKEFGSFADFAVVEIDFDKLDDFTAFSNNKTVTNKYKDKINKNNNSEFARGLAAEITNNYANDEKQHIKFRKNSYLKEYEKINYPLSGKIPENLDSLYAVGWPSSKGDFYLKQHIDDDQRKVAEHGFSLWTNTEYEYYDKNIVAGEGSVVSQADLEKYKRGNFLSYNVGYRSFKNMPGVLDIFIASPKTGKDFYILDGKKYINMGLGYMPRRYAPFVGASGSSIRNQNNELVAVYYATNTHARVGLSVAFRSEGFDYEGLYGNYNLPQYDLIYGGGKDQAKSYRQELEKLYKDKNIKTNLFKNGLDKEYDDFKFNNSNYLKFLDLNKK
ncbi:Ig-specific serine endopeptidase MIP [Metamycoplasma alkalescens]|uniref:Ig-specific serine endopeptidase MIP n=1 Tax=Metamycoplasma alkalescens TaxID=45363 RepID=UPI003D0536CC